MAVKYLARRLLRFGASVVAPGTDVTASVAGHKLNALLAGGYVAKVHTDTAFSNPAKQEIPTGTHTVTNAAITTNVATLTIGAHSYQVGQTLNVSGATTTTALNGTFVITAKAATTVSYALTHADVISGAETGTVSQERPLTKAIRPQPRTDKSFV